MKLTQTILTAVTLGLAMPMAAPAADVHVAHHEADAKPARQTALTAGVVKKVDKDAGKVTISHEPIENLGMPKMTMVFRVKDPVMLDQMKPGEKIDFAADKVDGAYTVVRVESAK